MSDGKARPFREAVILAPAKVNLGLEVRRKRPDGYHEIRTLFQAVSLCDRLVLRPLREGISLSSPGLAVKQEDNLAWRAAVLFFRETALSGGVEILLEKGIPAGGGLGGGSSDAAAVLLGLSRLYRLRPGEEDLARWAASLGSDVPFFLTGGAATGSGRGERIALLAGTVPKAAVLLYDPGFGSSTAAVYGDCRPRRLTRKGDELTILSKRWRKGEPRALGKALFNDLEETVFRRHPMLADVKAHILEQGAFGALVSGSGACLFGLFPSRNIARRVAGRLSGLPGRFMTADFLPPRLHWGVVKR